MIGGLRKVVFFVLLLGVTVSCLQGYIIKPANIRFG